MREYEAAMVEINVFSIEDLNVAKTRGVGECRYNCHLFLDRGARVGEWNGYEECTPRRDRSSLVVRGVERYKGRERAKGDEESRGQIELQI